MRILNKSHVLFTCTCAMAQTPFPLTVIEPNLKAYENTGTDNNILTDKCRLMGSFVSCRNIPTPAGSPGGPCAMALTMWTNASNKISVCGNNVLTEKSQIGCAVGGTIKPYLSVITRSNIDNGMSIKAEIPPVNIASVEIIKSAKSINNTTNSENSEILKSDTQKSKEIMTDLSENSCETGKKISEEVEVKEEIPSDKTQCSDNTDFSHALCNYKTCPEKENCEYLKSRCDASSIDNDAAKLLKNYKSRFPVEYENHVLKSERKNEESTEGNWSFAAHHIISGNQIFAKHPYLVKLANYYNYDINNAENCILLPTTHSFEGKTGVVKQANGYVAMDLMKQQWHVGGHSYSLEQETVEEIHRFLEKISYLNIDFYRNYVDAVEHEMNILESKYKKISCRKQGYAVKQQRFISGMNKISEKIKERLEAFETGYKHSYPFYVSKEACKFAFDVPKRKKFIIIYQKEKYKKIQTVAVKLAVTRYKKDDYEVLFTNDEEHIVSDSHSFIIFSENVKYFINLTGTNVIPWKLDDTREYLFNDIMTQSSVDEYCSENKQKIISFVEGRENGEMYYEPAARIIRQRMNDISVME